MIACESKDFILFTSFFILMLLYAPQPLRFTYTFKLLNFKFDFIRRVSQMLPSAHSPSDIRQYTFFSLLAKAMPRAIGNPCPSDPAEQSNRHFLHLSG